MSAEDNLSQQLFHGTHAELNPGDLVLPHGKLKGGKSNFGATSKSNLVYATPDENDAKYFAFNAAEENKAPAAHVYEVAPVGETKVNKMLPRNSDGSDRLQHVSKEGFKVIRKIHSKEFKTGQAQSPKEFWEGR